jgi:hypothetical protein
MNARTSELQFREQHVAALQSTSLAPRPKSTEDTGLNATFVGELLEKHFYDGGVLTLPMLSRRSALAGPILEEALGFLRKEGRVEVRAGSGEAGTLRFALTERGRASAQVAFARNGYVGPAPVPLELYAAVVHAQSVRSRLVSRERMRAAYADVVLDPEILDRLGPALNSGKAIFIYGRAGTGKTYVTQRLTRLMDDVVLIPHAISIGETVIRLFDPAVHVPLDLPAPGVLLDDGFDPRFVVCRRPLVITGGELSPDMLEVQFDSGTRQYRAPLQLKATNGLFILDDLGRQRVPPQTVLNRWIVPMEEARDYLSLATGQHFSVPFDVVLVFSTNMAPDDLADDAFLRRIGYKIQFEPLSPQQYHAIWDQVCEQRGVPYDPAVCQAVIDTLHTPEHMPLLPCHPRDLIDMALDHAAYVGLADELRGESLEWAWRNYFVKGHK